MEPLAIDLGRKESQICVRSSDGGHCQRAALPNCGAGRYLAGRPPSRVVIETWGIELKPEEKRALIEYLKTL